MRNDTALSTDGVVLLDAEAVRALVAGYGAAAATLSAVAEALQAQAVALHALADAIAAPVEEGEQDNRPRYLDGTLVDDG